MSAPCHGSWLGGVISFEVDEFDEHFAHSHCAMCRKFHGAGFATIAGVPRSGLRWLLGREELTEYTAVHGIVRSFCKICGSSLFFPACVPVRRSLGAGLTAPSR